MSKQKKKRIKLDKKGLIENIQHLLGQFQGESERGVALLAGALLDDVLAERLKEYFVQDSKAIKAALRFDRPLGTFSSRIEMGYLLGLYGPKTRASLDTIRDVRNDFAHFHQVARFADPEISKTCLGLLPGFAEWAMDDPKHPTCTDPRRRFQASVAWLIVHLLEGIPAREAPKAGDDYFGRAEEWYDRQKGVDE